MLKSYRFISLLFLLCISITGYSQHSLKWGKPSKEEIQLKVCSFDSTANAVVLAETGKLKFISNYVYLDVYRKIKVLNSNGLLEYANIDIPYYTEKGLDAVQNLKTQTINYENALPVITELQKDLIFTKVLSPNRHEKKLVFSNVKPGSILEYKYTLVSQNFL